MRIGGEENPAGAVHGEHRRSFKLGASAYKKRNTEEQNEWKLYYKNQMSLNSSIAQSSQILLKPFNRYRLFVVLESLHEMSSEFYDAQRITLVYSLIGFEQRVVLTTKPLLRHESAVPIRKVRLYYFFSDSPAAINKLLKDKDVTSSAKQ